MDAKSSKQDFQHNASIRGKKNVKSEKVYSDADVHRKLDTYQKFASEKDFSFLENLRSRYLDGKYQKDVSSGIQGKHFQDGVRSGLHPERSRQELDANFEKQMQRMRGKILDSAKGNYRSNYSLGRSFEKTMIDRDKGMS